MGERKVVTGPNVISLFYNEKLENTVSDVFILGQNETIELESQQDQEGKPAGFRWQISGACRYTPGKYEKIYRFLNSTLVNENQGIYVQNKETSTKKLIKGPKNYMLGVNEDLYEKVYTKDEIIALKLPTGYKDSNAVVINLSSGEAICVINTEDSSEKIIFGPQSKILGPNETVKVLSLSAGKPKQVNQIKAAIIRTGPDYMSDSFQVRTKDNAQLDCHVSYKWKFFS